MSSVATLLQEGIARLRAAGSETPRLDAELLLGHALGVQRTGLIAHPEAEVGSGPARTYAAGLARRERGEPVAYIRGIKEFYGLVFVTDGRGLIPRPETELLVELAEGAIADRLASAPRPAGSPPLRVVDVGTGTGTVAVALAVLLRRRRMASHVTILATDCSGDALDLARENAVGHGVADLVAFARADLVPPEARADLVVANLPYIPSAEVDRLPVAASFEPRVALDGGEDGLAAIRRLLARLPDLLEPGGLALLEIGADQAVAMAGLAGTLPGGWRSELFRDLAGRPRVVRLERLP